MSGRHDARIRRLEARVESLTGPDGVDMTGPLDPLQVAILDELVAYVPLKDQPDEAMPGIIRACVGRALGDEDLSSEEISELAPQYEELFNRYHFELTGEGEA